MAKKEEKKTALTMDDLQKTLDKAFGPNSLIELDDSEIMEVDVLSTNLPSLDLALGVGGLPRGRIVEVFGPEGAGKTALALRVISWCQQNAGKMPRTVRNVKGDDMKPISGRCGFIDMEHAFDPSLARIHEVRMGKGTGFHFSQPNSGEEAIEMLEYMLNSGLFDVIVVDSVAALTTKMENDANINDRGMAQIAQLMSNSLRKLLPSINASQTCVIFINQVREKPAVMYGSPETTPGGRALKFYASIRIRVSRGETIKEGQEPVGHVWIAKVVKNKVAPPFGKAEINLYYKACKKVLSAGFDVWADLIETAVALGIIEQGGSQYRYIDRETGEFLMKANGKTALVDFLSENTNIYDQIIADMMGGSISGEDSIAEEQE